MVTLIFWFFGFFSPALGSPPQWGPGAFQTIAHFRNHPPKKIIVASLNPFLGDNIITVGGLLWPLHQAFPNAMLQVVWPFCHLLTPHEPWLSCTSVPLPDPISHPTEDNIQEAIGHFQKSLLNAGAADDGAFVLLINQHPSFLKSLPIGGLSQWLQGLGTPHVNRDGAHVVHDPNRKGGVLLKIPFFLEPPAISSVPYAPMALRPRFTVGKIILPRPSQAIPPTGRPLFGPLGAPTSNPNGTSC